MTCPNIACLHGWVWADTTEHRVPCPTCHGTGELADTKPQVRADKGETPEPCAFCGGTGERTFEQGNRSWTRPCLCGATPDKPTRIIASHNAEATKREREAVRRELSEFTDCCDHIDNHIEARLAALDKENE